MSEKIEHAAPRRFLITDEVARLAHGMGPVLSVRIRVWRAKGAAPVALASQLEGEGPPSWMSAKVANHVTAGILLYPPEGLFYYEADRDAGGDARLWVVEFDIIGHADRAILLRPAREQRPWCEIESMTGSIVAF